MHCPECGCEWPVEHVNCPGCGLDADDIATAAELYDEFCGSRDDFDDSMDGDFDSGMTSAGYGTDEDYGYYGEDEWGF